MYSVIVLRCCGISYYPVTVQWRYNGNGEMYVITSEAAESIVSLVEISIDFRGCLETFTSLCEACALSGVVNTTS